VPFVDESLHPWRLVELTLGVKEGANPTQMSSTALKVTKEQPAVFCSMAVSVNLLTR